MIAGVPRDAVEGAELGGESGLSDHPESKGVTRAHHHLVASFFNRPGAGLLARRSRAVSSTRSISTCSMPRAGNAVD